MPRLDDKYEMDIDALRRQLRVPATAERGPLAAAVERIDRSDLTDSGAVVECQFVTRGFAQQPEKLSLAIGFALFHPPNHGPDWQNQA